MKVCTYCHAPEDALNHPFYDGDYCSKMCYRIATEGSVNIGTLKPEDCPQLKPEVNSDDFKEMMG